MIVKVGKKLEIPLESFLSLKAATLQKMNFPGAAITGTLRNFLEEMI